MLKHMKAHKHLKPGENGTLRLVERFGDCSFYVFATVMMPSGT